MGQELFEIQDSCLVRYFGAEAYVIIPDGITAIGDRAFCVWDPLQSVVIPESVGSIGKRAFTECRNLECIQIPENLTNIGTEAFLACEKLADANGFVIVNDILFSYHGAAMDVIIPEGVKEISGSAFSYAENLRSITVANTVTKIGRSAFVCGNTLQAVSIPENTTEIHETAFPRRRKPTIYATEGSYAADYARRMDVPLLFSPMQPADFCVDKKLEKTLQAGKDLYIDLLCGFKEMAEDARAESDVLSIVDCYLTDPGAMSDDTKATMEQKIWQGIAYVWERMGATVSCSGRVPLKKMQRLLRETYKALTLFHKENAIPKGLACILLSMDEYLRQAWQFIHYAQGDAEAIAWRQYGLLYDMVQSLKEAFFHGEYNTPYPVLSVYDSSKNMYLFDVLNDDLKELAQALPHI